VWEGSRVEHWHCHKTNYIFHLPQQEHTRHHLSTMPPIIIIIIIITYQLQTKKIKNLVFKFKYSSRAKEMSRKKTDHK
jgi:hypothetical protein